MAQDDFFLKKTKPSICHMTTIPMLIKFQQYIVVCLFHFTVSKATTVYLYLQSTVRPMDLPKRADSKDYK